MDRYMVDEERKQPRKGLVYVILAGALLIALGLALGLGLGLQYLKKDPVPTEQSTTPPVTPAPVDDTPKSHTGTYRFASVSADSKTCSEIGTVTLAQGGSAVDAAIATALCNGVVNPASCGIGGGFFMTIYNRSNARAYVLDARERAPMAANSSLYIGREKGASLNGGLAIAVPGEVKGYWEAHQRFGKLPWKYLFQPAIKLCREGVKINKPLDYAIGKSIDLIRKNNFSMYFDPETNATLKKGDMVKYQRLANTLEVIALGGESALYDGNLTDTIVREIQDNGGIITRDDLTRYNATWRSPVTFTLRDGNTIHSMPPPGSGAVLEYMLNILDGYNLSKESISTDEKSILTYHRIVEAMKFAFAKRTELGDEDFEDVADLVRNMTSHDFGDAVRARINDTKTQDTEYYNPSYFGESDQGTSHISIVDALGNAVAMTSTVNYYFGSKVMGSTTGIVYNNEMDDFSTPGIVNIYGVSASPINFIKPGKRPLSSMCPAVVANNSSDVVLVLGGAGGTRITTAALMVALHTMKFDRSAGESLDYKRLHHQLLPTTLQIEEGFPKTVVNGLKAKGHNTTAYSLSSSMNIIKIKEGMKHAACDVRKGATPDGY